MSVLHELERAIIARAGADPESSWTARLLSHGTGRCAEKFGEEAIEAIVAAASERDDALVHECADVLYHLLVLLRSRGVELDTVLSELSRRRGLSGIEEKSSRGDQG